MRLISGKIYLDKTNHRVAYCAQNPWLEHATIRDNIVYGSPSGFDEQRYDSIIRACALEKDLEILPAGWSLFFQFIRPRSLSLFRRRHD